MKVDNSVESKIKEKVIYDMINSTSLEVCREILLHLLDNYSNIIALDDKVSKLLTSCEGCAEDTTIQEVKAIIKMMVKSIRLSYTGNEEGFEKDVYGFIRGKVLDNIIGTAKFKLLHNKGKSNLLILLKTKEDNRLLHTLYGNYLKDVVCEDEIFYRILNRCTEEGIIENGKISSDSIYIFKPYWSNKDDLYVGFLKTSKDNQFHPSLIEGKKFYVNHCGTETPVYDCTNYTATTNIICNYDYDGVIGDDEANYVGIVRGKLNSCVARDCNNGIYIQDYFENNNTFGNIICDTDSDYFLFNAYCSDVQVSYVSKINTKSGLEQDIQEKIFG